ncbi:MAG: hypothetical protein KDK70_30215, partial [Myxococcales bacterium]|nr:hypothetical protein [Myxococcales bacterium]
MDTPPSQPRPRPCDGPPCLRRPRRHGLPALLGAVLLLSSACDRLLGGGEMPEGEAKAPADDAKAPADDAKAPADDAKAPA